MFVVRGNIGPVVDLWAPLWLAVLSWCLITMPDIYPEHELVGDFVKIGDVRSEFMVSGLEHISQLDLDEFVEFLGALGAI